MPVSATSIRRFFLLVLGTVGLILVACGDGGDTDPSPTATAASATPGAETTPTVEPTAAPTNEQGERVAGDGDSVLVHYHGTLDDGEVFDSSRERDPLPFVVGTGDVIKGFDDAVRGMAVGETKTVRLEPADAYGEADPNKIFELSVDDVPEDMELAVGDAVSYGGLPATVTDITDETITLDANGGLVGKALTFEIELVSIQ